MPIRAITHAGFAAVEHATPALRLIAVHGTGPRLARLSEPATLRGGHRQWTGRMGADEDKQTYANDDAAGTCALAAIGCTVTGAPCRETRTERSISLRILRADRIMVVNRIVNRCNLLFGCGA